MSLNCLKNPRFAPASNQQPAAICIPPFLIYLPKQPTMSQSPKIIFIVDDEELSVKMLADFLSKDTGLDVRTFNTGEDCVKELLHTHPHVIILDYLLNSKFKDALNGLQILDIIRKLDKHVHVIMLSGSDSYVVGLQTIAHGAEHYIMKSEESFEEVLEIIRATK